MGVVQSIPTETLLAVGVAGAAAVGATYYANTQGTPESASLAAAATKASDAVLGTGAGTKSNSKSGKKKKSAAATAASSAAAGVASAASSLLSPSQSTPAEPPAPRVVSFPTVVPGSFDVSANDTDSAAGASAASKPKSKKKKAAKKAPAAGGGVSGGGETSDASHAGPSKGTPTASRPSTIRRTSMLDNDKEPWTKVDRKRSGIVPTKGTESSDAAASRPPVAASTSDAGVTTSVTGTTTPTTERTDDEEDEDEEAEEIPPIPVDNRRTLAEKMAPKPRKTRVEDMLETPDVPSLARVMRIAPPAGQEPPAGFTWADYEDVKAGNDADQEDDGAGWGVVKSRRPAASTPAGQGPKLTSADSSSGGQTQKQRQNAAKRDAQKEAKAAAESARLAILAKHKRDIERERIAELHGGTSSKGRKGVSSGMSASVDENYKVVYN